MAKKTKNLDFRTRVTTSLSRKGVRGVEGAFIDLLLPLLLQALQGCLQPKPNPTPQPKTSKATPEAWKQADEAKDFALSKVKSGDPEAEDVVYKRAATNAAIRDIRRKKKRNGETLSKEEATLYVESHLDALRLGDMEENALLIDANTKTV